MIIIRFGDLFNQLNTIIGWFGLGFIGFLLIIIVYGWIKDGHL